MIRENGGWYTFDMIEVEKYPCNDRREAEKRECEFMKEWRTNMNTYLSFVTEAETKEKEKGYDKKYREKNKDKLNAKHREYRKLNADKIKKARKKINSNIEENKKNTGN